MGESSDTPLKLQFDRRVRLDFRGATITSDAGLLACRELDAALGLTETANDYIHESRTGRNVQHGLLPLLRQSVYSRLAGYEDTNDAERLAQDPAMRVIVGWQGTDKQAASTNTMSRFETEVLTEEKNLDGLARLNVEWVDRGMAQTSHQRVIPSTCSGQAWTWTALKARCMGSKRESPTTATSSPYVITRSSCSTISEIAKVQCFARATSTALSGGGRFWSQS